MAAQRLAYLRSSVPTSSRVTVNLARLVNRRRVKPSNNQRPDGLAQYALNIIRERYTDFGQCWRVKSLQNRTMSTCTKKLSGRLWLKPVLDPPATTCAENSAIVLPVVVS